MWTKITLAVLLSSLGAWSAWKVTDLYWRNEVTELKTQHQTELATARNEEQSKCAAAQRATKEVGDALQTKFDALRRNYNAVLKRVRDSGGNNSLPSAPRPTSQPPQGTKPAGLPTASRAEDIDEEELSDAYAADENLTQLNSCLGWILLIRSQFGLK